MRMKSGLALFTRTNTRGSYNLAAFHSRHSLTWSWILSFSLPRSRDEGRWFSFHRWRDNNGLQWLLQIGRCALQWHRQRPMWYSDLYMRLRDERDGLLREPRSHRIYQPPPSPTPSAWIGGGLIH